MANNLEFLGHIFTLCPGVYAPAEDSFLLARHLETRARGRVLDMGTGCGIQGITASSRADEVLACDINPEAVVCARENCETNGVTNMEVVESDIFGSVAGKFDVITFNPPYLPSNPEDPDDNLRKAWDGGSMGREMSDRFMAKAKRHLNPGGTILLVQSSHNDVERTVSMLKEQGLGTEIIAEESFFFERLYLLEASL